MSLFHRPALLLSLVWICSGLIQAESSSQTATDLKPLQAQAHVHFRITIKESITLMSQKEGWQASSNNNLLLLSTPHKTQILQQGHTQNKHTLSQSETWVIASP